MRTLSDLSAAKIEKRRGTENPSYEDQVATATGSSRFLIALLALASWSGFAATRDGSAGPAPLNSHTRCYGGGWECDREYQSVHQSFVAVEVPPNGYLSSSGRDWECERGFKKGLRTCVALRVPMNAHLGHSGNIWTCDAGYRQQGETCTKDRR